jgi:hypothetical protein
VRLRGTSAIDASLPLVLYRCESAMKIESSHEINLGARIGDMLFRGFPVVFPPKHKSANAFSQNGAFVHDH